MFDIVRHLSHKSITRQNNRPSPRNETIGLDDVKNILETDSDLLAFPPAYRSQPAHHGRRRSRISEGDPRAP